MAGDLVGNLELRHQHGKARVRVARVWKGKDGHAVVEWLISITLTSKCLAAYTVGDNSAIVATDTMKNTVRELRPKCEGFLDHKGPFFMRLKPVIQREMQIQRVHKTSVNAQLHCNRHPSGFSLRFLLLLRVYALAKQCKEATSVENFGIILGKHFIRTYPEVTAVEIHLTQKPWERIISDSEPHQHGFKLGSEKRTAVVVASADGSVEVKSGISELNLLKTTKSGFEGFIRDKYTVLPEVNERMMASSIRSVWSYTKKPLDYDRFHAEITTVLIKTFFGPPQSGVYSPSVQNTLYLMAKEVLLRFPEVESVYLNMPNIHFLPVKLPSIGLEFEDDVYLPTDEPHGSIEASLTRKGLSPSSKL